MVNAMTSTDEERYEDTSTCFIYTGLSWGPHQATQRNTSYVGGHYNSGGVRRQPGHLPKDLNLAACCIQDPPQTLGPKEGVESATEEVRDARTRHKLSIGKQGKARND